MLRKRPLLTATMFGGAGFGNPAAVHIGRADSRLDPAGQRTVHEASSEENRIDALTKLKSLLDAGVLNSEQYESEWTRLTGGIRMRRRR
jgi:hypothetical protein